MKTLTAFIAEATWHHGTYSMQDINAHGWQKRERRPYNFEKKDHDDPIPKAVYFAKSEGVARSYAVTERAWDRDRARTGIVSRDLSHVTNTLNIHAGGKDFHNVPYDSVEAAVPDHQKEAFKDIIKKHVYLRHGSGVSTEDLETVSHKLGYQGYKVSGVVDDYNAKGRPSTIMAVFPEHLK